jgi:hypothetical protein
MRVAVVVYDEENIDGGLCNMYIASENENITLT